MTCTLIFGGDIAPIRGPSQNLFGELAPIIRQADLAVANLEIALTDLGQRMRGKAIAERGPPHAIQGLLQADFNAVNLANNHVLDYGEAALRDTLNRLAAAGLPCFGAGRDLAEAAAPVLFERNGLRIALLGYTSTLPQGFAAAADAPGVNPLRAITFYRHTRNPEEYPGSAMAIETRPNAEDLARMVVDIGRAKLQADVVLVYQHWGASMTEQVLDFQRAIGQAAIDAGAAGVFGGHQHVISAIEFYKGCPIVHGMGNLLFDIIEPFLTDITHRTFLFSATIASDGLRDCEVVPCRAGVAGVYDAPMPLAPDSDLGRKIVGTLQRLSAPFGTDIEVAKERVRVRPAR
jgi:poly-gamma-glutamate capsule biosynthesis protein CapA/YwtB (metallophosphatase superfamily)